MKYKIQYVICFLFLISLCNVSCVTAFHVTTDPEKHGNTKLTVGSLGDVAISAGTGAVIAGPPGVAGGALIGLFVWLTDLGVVESIRKDEGLPRLIK